MNSSIQRIKYSYIIGSYLQKIMRTRSQISNWKAGPQTYIIRKESCSTVTNALYGRTNVKQLSIDNLGLYLPRDNVERSN